MLDALEGSIHRGVRVAFGRGQSVADRFDIGARVGEIVQRVRDGRLRTNIGTVSTLDDAVAALNPTARRPEKTIIRVRP